MAEVSSFEEYCKKALYEEISLAKEQGYKEATFTVEPSFSAALQDDLDSIWFWMAKEGRKLEKEGYTVLLVPGWLEEFTVEEEGDILDHSEQEEEEEEPYELEPKASFRLADEILGPAAAELLYDCAGFTLIIEWE